MLTPEQKHMCGIVIRKVLFQTFEDGKPVDLQRVRVIAAVMAHEIGLAPSDITNGRIKNAIASCYAQCKAPLTNMKFKHCLTAYCQWLSDRKLLDKAVIERISDIKQPVPTNVNEGLYKGIEAAMKFTSDFVEKAGGSEEAIKMIQCLKSMNGASV